MLRRALAALVLLGLAGCSAPAGRALVLGEPVAAPAGYTVMCQRDREAFACR